MNLRLAGASAKQQHIPVVQICKHCFLGEGRAYKDFRQERCMSPLIYPIICDTGDAVYTGGHPLPPGDNSKWEKAGSLALQEDGRLICLTL